MTCPYGNTATISLGAYSTNYKSEVAMRKNTVLGWGPYPRRERTKVNYKTVVSKAPRNRSGYGRKGLVQVEVDFSYRIIADAIVMPVPAGPVKSGDLTSIVSHESGDSRQRS